MQARTTFRPAIALSVHLAIVVAALGLVAVVATGASRVSHERLASAAPAPQVVHVTLPRVEIVAPRETRFVAGTEQPAGAL